MRGEAVADHIATSQLHAPDLLPYEVANTLRRRVLAGALSRTEATLAHDGALAMPIELWPHAVIATRAWELLDVLTSYDAAYVALAERLHSPLVTADGRLARAPGIQASIHLV